MKERRNEKGMVLLLVLVVVALLTSLIVEFAFSTLIDMRLVETFRDSTRAYYLAKGGVTAGRMVLRDDKNRYDARDELWSQGINSYPVGDGFITVEIQDLSGRLDLNRLVKRLVIDGEERANINVPVKDRFLLLFEDLGLDAPAALVDSLIDWIDPDADPEPEGAEDDYYLRLESPYPAKNGPIDTLEELTMVRGFTPEIVQRLEPHITVSSEDDKVNVNTASLEVLMSLNESMDRSAAEAIIAFRQEAPVEKVEELRDLPGLGQLYSAIFNYLRVDSPVYRIVSWGTVGDGSRTLVARVRKTDNRLLYMKVN